MGRRTMQNGHLQAAHTRKTQLAQTDTAETFDTFHTHCIDAHAGDAPDLMPPDASNPMAALLEWPLPERLPTQRGRMRTCSPGRPHPINDCQLDLF